MSIKKAGTTYLYANTSPPRALFSCLYKQIREIEATLDKCKLVLIAVCLVTPGDNPIKTFRQKKTVVFLVNELNSYWLYQFNLI
jgi:hypothetical protein